MYGSYTFTDNTCQSSSFYKPYGEGCVGVLEGVLQLMSLHVTKFFDKESVLKLAKLLAAYSY